MKILGIDPGYAILGFGVVEMKGNRFEAWALCMQFLKSRV